MTTQNHARPSLDDVLEQYMAEGPSYASLNDYVRRFPEYRDVLADVTVQWSAMEHVETEAADGPDPDVEVAIAAVRGLIHQGTTTEPTPNAEADAPPSPVVSQPALSAGDASGVPADRLEIVLAGLDIDLFDFEEASGLGYSLLINLSAGGFTFESPEERECVARALRHHIQTFEPDAVPALPAVARSISMPSMIMAGQASSPNNKPEAVTKTFRQGIEDARDMTDEAKAEWLRILDEAC